MCPITLLREIPKVLAYTGEPFSLILVAAALILKKNSTPTKLRVVSSQLHADSLTYSFT